jgi:hypothetical protein
LSQILGKIPGFPTPPPAFAAPPAVSKRAYAAPRTAEAPAPKQRAVTEPLRPPPPKVKPPPPGWWGASTFVWVGCLGSSRQEAEDDEHGAQERGFSEADQVAAFNAVTDAAVKGHKGLGLQHLPKKVAGARWAGTRTVLDADGGDDDDEDRGGDRQHAGGAAAPPSGAGADELAKVKWKKHAARFLRGRPGGEAPLEEVLDHVVGAAQLPDDVCRVAAMAALSRRLGKSSNFELAGDVARLIAGAEEDA